SRADIKTRTALIERIKSIIGYEEDLPQTAISFCLAYEAVSTVIPGNITIDQLNANIKSVHSPISTELVNRLEAFYENEVKALHLPW
ncbi:MAG: aldo/keto reductase, partial [Flavobacteriaceae bacterium]|nr:aldo/keto reductase [Flavobacteriaceae bacterium]